MIQKHVYSLIALVSLVCCAPVCNAQSYAVTTIAGTATAGYAGDGGAAASAQLNFPVSIVLSGGTLYVADQLNQVVRTIAVGNGTISTVAGNNTKGYSGDGSTAQKAQLTTPTGVAVASNGNLYIADAGNNVVRLVLAAGGNISTIAGNFSAGAGYSGDGALATGAQLTVPYALLLDPAGNLYISDASNNRVRKVTTDGNINTVAGTGTPEYVGDGGPATLASINHPEGLAMDAAGNLYFTDTMNHAIRKVDTKGIITTVVGTGFAGFSGDGGSAKLATLNRPEAIAFDAAGNLYIADTFNQRIRRVLANGTIETIAGTGFPGFSGDGGNALTAQFRFPRGLAVDALGNVYVSDNQNSVIRKLAPSPTPTSAPTINSNGIISASDYGMVSTSTPGSWVEIYGQNFSLTSRAWSAADFNGINAPTSLDGVSVTVGGLPAYVSYISPGQVNALIPSNAGTGAQPIVVTNAAGASAPMTIQLKAIQPQLYAPASINAAGKQYVAAFFADGAVALPPNGTTAFRRAKAGDLLKLYGIGFGPVTPNAPTGQLVQSPNVITTPLRIFFNGTEATGISYAGLITGTIGLYQFNVTVPPGIAASDLVQVTFTVGAVPGTQTLYTAIGN